MSHIFRVWIYKEARAPLYPDANPSATNIAVVREVVGEFRYFRRIGSSVVPANRKDGYDYQRRTGKKVFTYRGYPAFMRDLGYR